MNNLERYYQILGLEPGASLGEIKQAYRDLAFVWHPDRFPDTPHLKQRAEAEIKKINEAYQHLKTFQPIYPNQTSSWTGTGIYSTYWFDADTFYNQGMENARRGRYKQAIEDFTQAIRLNPNHIKAYKYRGLACAKLGYENRAAADANKAAQLERKQRKTTSTPPSQPTAWKFLRTLTGHTNWVFSIAISPDGQTLVSGSADKTIKIWHLPTGTLLNTLIGHSEWVRSVAISPDGQMIVSGSDDHSIKIWHLATGKLLHTLTGQSAAVWSISISPDGSKIVSSGQDKRIEIWNLKTGERLPSCIGCSNSVYSVAISPDGQTLASGSCDKTIEIWHLGMDRLLHVLKGHSSWVNSVAFSPDGQTLASASYDKTIKLWRLGASKPLNTLTWHHSHVGFVVFGANGHLASRGDNTIKLWQPSSGKLVSSLNGHADWVNSVAFSRQGNILASCSRDMTIRVWQCD